MNITQQNQKKRLLYILHLGFVEVRNLALVAGNQQIADLADALELLPRFIEDCTEEDQETIRFVLKTYQEKYQSIFDYPARFDLCDPPERY